MSLPGVVVHTFSPNMKEAAPGQTGLHNEILSQQQQKRKKERKQPSQMLSSQYAELMKKA